MKNLIKVLTILLAIFMITGVVAGCSGKDGSSTTKEETTKEETTKEETTKEETKEEVLSGALITKEPLELTNYLYMEKPFDDEYAVFKKAAELTNIILKGTLPQSVSDEKQAFQIMMASGDLPDIIARWGRDDFMKYGKEGAFIPLNDLIDKCAPNIKDFLENYPDVKLWITAEDGNIYHIPWVPDGNVAKGWFIRQDWLEKLELEVPKTIDQYHDVLKAFRERDPNGNGEKDEIPYFNRQAGKGWERGIEDLSYLWRAYQEWYEVDGKVHYGPFETEYKTAYKTIAQWYKEGLIDPEIYTRGSKSRDILLTDRNVGGSTHDYFGSTSGYNDNAKNIEGFKFLPIAPPEGTDGKVKESSGKTRLSDAGWAISCDCKYQEEAMKYFDFWFSEEGRLLANAGVEGIHFDMINGKVVIKDSILNDPNKAPLQTFWDAGAQLYFGYHQDFNVELQWMNPIARKGCEEYSKNKYGIKIWTDPSMTEVEKERISELMANIKTYKKEMSQKWVLGAESVDDTYDNYINELKKLGVEEMISIMQQAYDRYNK